MFYFALKIKRPEVAEHTCFRPVIVGAGPGSNPEVRVFGGGSLNAALLRDFYAYDLSFTGGVRVGAADVDGDGHADIITGTGPGTAPLVRVFSGV